MDKEKLKALLCCVFLVVAFMCGLVLGSNGYGPRHIVKEAKAEIPSLEMTTSARCETIYYRGHTIVVISNYNGSDVEVAWVE